MQRASDLASVGSMFIVADVVLVLLVLVQLWKCCEYVLGIVQSVSPRRRWINEPPLFAWADKRAWTSDIANVVWRGPIMLVVPALLLAALSQHVHLGPLVLASVVLVLQLTLQLGFMLAAEIGVGMGKRRDPRVLSGLVFRRTGAPSPFIDPILTFGALAATITIVFMAEYLATRQVDGKAFWIAKDSEFGVLDSYFFSLSTFITVGDNNVHPRALLARTAVAGEIMSVAVLIYAIASSLLTRRGDGRPGRRHRSRPFRSRVRL